MQRKQMVVEQRRQTILLERQKQRMAGILHEIKNPLTTLKGEIALLSTRGDPALISAVERMQRSETRIEQGLRALSIGDAVEQQQAQQKPCTFADLERLLAKHLTANPVPVHIQNHAADKQKTMRLDPLLFLEAVDNLLGNANRYAKKQITLTLQDEAPFMRVCDDGPGFLEEALQHAMDKYYSEEQKTDHIGYGLYIARVLLEKQQIRLTLANRGGACAELTFLSEQKDTNG